VLGRDDVDGSWHFRLSDDQEGAGTDLTVLPCALLSDMKRLVESSPQSQFAFELTGQLYLYRGRDYLLPTHAPRMATYAPPVPPPDPRAPDGPVPDSPQEMLRRLNETVGPVARSPRGGEPDIPRQGPPEGSFILWRRATMMREPAGAWSLRFEADAAGLADPPMILLPCLLLERMEQYVERVGREPAMIVSGRTFRYEERAYMLPTAFMIPRDRPGIRP
jgi:hypothetical protein